jgi:hypothetical protein
MLTSRRDRQAGRFRRVSGFVAVIALLCIGRAEAAVTVESFSGGIVRPASSAAEVSWTHAVGATGADHLLVVLVMAAVPPPCATDPAVTSVTYDGKPLQLSTSAHVNCYALSVFHLVNPPHGKHQVVARLSMSANTIAGSYSLTGVDQLSPLNHPTMPLCQVGVPSNLPGVGGCTVYVLSAPGGYLLETIGHIPDPCESPPAGAGSDGPPNYQRWDFASRSPNLRWLVTPANGSGALPDQFGYGCVCPSCGNPAPAADEWVVGLIGFNPSTPVTKSISGRVTNPDGTPRVGVSLDLDGSENSTQQAGFIKKTATTNANGEYAFNDLSLFWRYRVTPTENFVRFTPASAGVERLDQDLKYDFVAAAGTSTSVSPPPSAGVLDRWVIKPNPKLPKQLGRIAVAFPPGVNVSGTVVQVFAPGSRTALHSGVASQSQTISPGTYDVVIQNVRIAGVPVRSANDTTIRVGALHVSGGNQTRFFVLSEDQKQQFVNSYGNATIGLPVGNYVLKIDNRLKPITIGDGQVTNF